MSSAAPLGSFVLVVEDDEDNRELLVTLLQSANLAVRGAATVAEAHAIIATDKPEFLVADYSLPDGTAASLLDLCASARPRVCILVTGFDDTDVTATGFDVVLTKPVSFEKLLAAIRTRTAPTR